MAADKKIPVINPSQFDDYLFKDWKAPVFDLYEKFHISRVEHYRTHIKLPTPPHRRSVYFFLFLTKGRAIRSKGLNQYGVTPHTAFCLAADQITSFDYLSKDAEGFYCHFLPEILNHRNLKVDAVNDFPYFKYTHEPLLSIADSSRIVQLLHILESDYQSSRTEMLPVYLFSILKEFNIQGNTSGSPGKDAATLLTQRYKSALSQFIGTKKRVAEYADYLSVTPNYLHKCVKATTGKTAHALMDEMRSLEAMVLLKQTNLSIAEIASKVGKEDPSDFSRFFKSQTKLTPNQYRKSQ